MPIFGQVWLWSSLAFLLGALLCWVLVALPARRRVNELEDELLGGHRRPSGDLSELGRHARPDRDTRDSRDSRGGYEPERAEPEHVRSGLADLHEEPEPLTRAYAAMPGTRFDAGGGLVAPPETDPADTELADLPSAETTQYLGKLETQPEVPAKPGGRGWFDDDAAHQGEPLEAITQLRPLERPARDVRLVDDEADTPPASGGTIFTQHTHPIPGELIRQLDEAGKTEAATDEPADALVDDLADEDAANKIEKAESEPATPGESAGKRRGAEVPSRAKPEAEPTGTAPADGAHGQTEVMPVASTIESSTDVVPPSGRRSGADKSRRGTDEPKIMPGVSVRAEPESNPLPKRVPSKPRGHTPFGVETAPLPEPAGDTAAADAERSRALFEPIVPAEEGSSVMPPPHRVHGDGDGNGRGPFGPGSAMPLPGGASPSPEFTIKASVSAQRYCTPESPQFGRTVAEVWFKTPADAERVGFRPVS